MEPSRTTSQQRIGLIYAIVAYFAWGISVVYFKQLSSVPGLDVLVYRVIGSVVFLAIIISLQKRWNEVREAMRNRATLGRLILTAGMICINWIVFITVINQGRVLQASLGYYMNPLFSVLLALVVLREKLRGVQVMALLIAAAGVLYFTLAAGEVPWHALTLATTFAFYGLFRKTMPVGPLIGLMVETLLLTPLALIYLMGLMMIEPARLTGLPAETYGWLMLAGVVTTLPLLWFANGAKRLKLTTMGFLQYIAPSVNFILAVFVYKETFGRPQWIAFTCIWTALAIYSIDSWRTYRSAPRPPAPTPKAAPPAAITVQEL